MDEFSLRVFSLNHISICIVYHAYFFRISLFILIIFLCFTTPQKDMWFCHSIDKFIPHFVVDILDIHNKKEQKILKNLEQGSYQWGRLELIP